MKIMRDASVGILTLVLMVTSTARAVGGEPSGLQEKGPASPAAKAGGEQAASAPAPKPATAKVEHGPFKVEVSLTGVFESAKMAEVSVKPRAWSQPLVVEKAIELGSPVKQGDILVEFDREKIDKAIQDAEVENLLGEQALKQAEEELPVLEKLLPIDLAAAERARTEADEDLKRFLEIDRPDAEKMANFAVKSAAEYLEYAKEELRQLEKMYRSKDLTEETEEIILRRTRFQVESGEVRLKEAELRRDATLEGRAAAPGDQGQGGRGSPVARAPEGTRQPAPDPEPEAAGPGQAQARPRPGRREARRPAEGPREPSPSTPRPTAWSTTGGANTATGPTPPPRGRSCGKAA